MPGSGSGGELQPPRPAGTFLHLPGAGHTAGGCGVSLLPASHSHRRVPTSLGERPELEPVASARASNSPSQNRRGSTDRPGRALPSSVWHVAFPVSPSWSRTDASGAVCAEGAGGRQRKAFSYHSHPPNPYHSHPSFSPDGFTGFCLKHSFPAMSFHCMATKTFLWA